MSEDQPKPPTADDAHRLAAGSSLEELQRMNVAEDILEKRYQRERRTRRVFSVSQALVGYVALAGFFANAYQNYNNKKEAEARSVADEARWTKEFKRAQDADKYRAFFETSALATDPHNSDKRLVGYALLKEFVDDKDYNSKATFMLEESLALELRDEKDPGLDEPHQAAVTAILGALSHTSDCKALGRAARTIEKLALHRVDRDDVEEASEVLGLYIYRIFGRAAQVCQPKDLLEVRKPIREFMLKQPDLAGLPPKPTPEVVDRRIAEILRLRAAEDVADGVQEAEEIQAAFKKSCEALLKDASKDGDSLCTAPPPSAPELPPAPKSLRKKLAKKQNPVVVPPPPTKPPDKPAPAKK